MRFSIRNMDSMSDDALLQLYRESGETEYFGVLYNRSLPLVYGLCMKYLKLPEDAEDAVMQLFEDLLGKVLRHEIANFRSWLYRVTQNHCLQILRHKGKEIVTDLTAQPADSADFLDLLGGRGDDGQLKALHHCMERLPDEQRVCISEFFLAEKSYADIAEQRGFQSKSVKSYIQNGKRNLRLCIEKTTKEWGCCHI